MKTFEIERSKTKDVTDGELREFRRLGLEAAYVAFDGDVDRALMLIAAAQDLYPHITLSHPFAAARALCMAQRSADLSAIRYLMISALDEPEILEDRESYNSAISGLFATVHIRFDLAWWEDAIARASLHLDLVDVVNKFVLDSYRGRLSSSLRQRSLRLKEVARFIEGRPTIHLSSLVVGALHVKWLPGEANFIDEVFARAPQTRGVIALGSIHRAIVARRSGDWIGAKEAAERGLVAARAGNCQYWIARLQSLLAVNEAMLGAESDAAGFSFSAEAWALHRGHRTIIDEVVHASSLLSLATGRFEEAHTSLTNFPTDPERWSSSAYGMLEALDLAEACARLGRAGDAAEAIEAMASYEEELSPHNRLLFTAAKATVELDDEVARSLFVSAVQMDAMLDSPFDAARIRLAYGHRLSLGAGLVEARKELRLALWLFNSLDAHHWAARARRELDDASSGPSVRIPAAASGSAVFVPLSRQEELVAQLAAQGLSNSMIGEQLFISSRTVGYHLYNAFPKLGVTSRGGIRDALEARGLTRPR